jgi:hypothetical protein
MVLPRRLGRGAISRSSDDVNVESCRRWRCRGDVGRGAMSLLRHAGDGAAEVTLAVAQCRCQVMLTTTLSSHATDGAADATWPRRDVDAESC